MNHILIEWDKDPDRVVVNLHGKPADLIVAMVNAMEEITRTVGKPDNLGKMVIAISQGYQSRVFSEGLTSVHFDTDKRTES